MHVIVTCNYENEHMKNSQEKLETLFFQSLPYLLPWKPVFGSSRISNSSKLSCVLSLPASLKRIRLRTAEKKWRHHFSHYKPMGIFPDFQGQLTPQSVVQSSRNSNSSELSCMSQKGTDEKPPRKSGDTVFPIITLSVTMETTGRIWPNFKLIQALMYVINTCKYEKDLIKNSREKVETLFFPL